MNTKTALFSLISIRPQTIKELVERLPYSRHSIYKALEKMQSDGLLSKQRQGKEALLSIAPDYKNQKMREFHLKALSQGLDPQPLLDRTALAVWRSSEGPSAIKDICNNTRLSYLTVWKALSSLKEAGLLLYLKGKPLIVTKNKDSALGRILEQLDQRDSPERAFLAGTSPMDIIIEDPDAIEKMLYTQMDAGFSVRNTGLVVKGSGRPRIIRSASKGQLMEDAFLSELLTPEGVEDICIKVVSSKRLDYDALLELAILKGLTNVVGCYLDIISDIEPMVPQGIIARFLAKVTKKRVRFLKQMRKQGKQGWEQRYEKKWNVDLYLDIGAIEHGGERDMNLEDFPEMIKKDIEDRSLEILAGVADDIMVIGGWAVRALTSTLHKRYTLDIDGVCPVSKLDGLRARMLGDGFGVRDTKWGFQFYIPYVPRVSSNDANVMERVKAVELRVEILGPKIEEQASAHYFEFDLDDYMMAKIPYHGKPGDVEVTVPSIEQMAAVKLGLPADYKNNFDSAVLLAGGEVGRVVEMIKSNDDWCEMVLRRLPKARSCAKDKNRLEYALLVSAGVNVREHVKKMDAIEEALIHRI